MQIRLKQKIKSDNLLKNKCGINDINSNSFHFVNLSNEIILYYIKFRREEIKRYLKKLNLKKKFLEYIVI